MGEAGEIVDLSRRIDELSLERAQRVARFDAARGYEAEGCANTVAFLKTRCSLSASAAMEILSVARRLDELPRVQEAMAQGRIGFGHASVIAASVERVGEVAARQEELVERAEQVDPSQLREVTRRVERQVDAERARVSEEALYRSRRFFLQKLGDGRFRVEGVLDADGGAVLKTALSAAMGPRAKDEMRAEPQRRADALVDVATRALDGRRFGETGRQAPHVVMTLDGDTGDAEIQGLGPVARETVERVLCDCSLSVNGSPERRTFSAPLRRRLMKGRSHCQFPGCDRPADWCEGHHLERYRPGNTVLENGAMLCGFHHRLMHEGGWKAVRECDQLVVISPLGERFKSTKSPPAA